MAMSRGSLWVSARHRCHSRCAKVTGWEKGRSLSRSSVGHLKSGPTFKAMARFVIMKMRAQKTCVKRARKNILKDLLVRLISQLTLDSSKLLACGRWTGYIYQNTKLSVIAVERAGGPADITTKKLYDMSIGTPNLVKKKT